MPTARDLSPEIAILDAAVAEVTGLMSEHIGEPLACSSCTDPACCEDAVFITREEADHLAASLRKKRRFVLQRIRRWKLDGMARLGDAVLEQLRSQKDRTPQLREYWRARHPCPLLMKHGGCMAYEHRPRACRRHHAFGDPSACRRYQAGEGDAPFGLIGASIEQTEMMNGSTWPMRLAHDPPDLLPRMLEAALKRL